VPEEEEIPLNEAQSDKTSANSAQEKRNKRIALSIAAVFFLLTIVTAYFIATKGFDYVRQSNRTSY
jgi:hypothetical protein